MAAASWTRRRRSASCRCISPAASRRRGATLADLVAARPQDRGLYSNLITSGVRWTRRADRAAEGGRASAHVQLSIQDVDHQTAAFIANYPGRPGQEAGLRPHGEGGGLPVHSSTPSSTASEHHAGRAHDRSRGRAGAGRVEMAHAQYYGWAIKNRAALMPTLEQVHEATRHVDGRARAAARPDRDRLRAA